MSELNPSGSAPLHHSPAWDHLRLAMQQYLQQPVSDGAIRTVLREICAEAHAQGLQAEQLVVAFKQLWSSLPEIQRLGASGEREQLRAHLVSLCIDEFYSGE